MKEDVRGMEWGKNLLNGTEVVAVKTKDNSAIQNGEKQSDKVYYHLIIEDICIYY